MNWISVNDRLPEEYKPVLMYAEGTARQGNTTLVGACHDGFWFIQNSQAALGFPNLQYKVTHWMPLPEPPKEVHP